MLRNLIFNWSGTLVDEAAALLPHALNFLRFCQATRRRTFLLGPIRGADFTEQCAGLGIAHFFEKTYIGGTDDGTCVAKILVANHLAPTETALICDTARDVEVARHGGAMAIVTLTGIASYEKLGYAHPDVIVRDLEGLQKLLENAPSPDEIRIEELELSARVGVPEEERAAPQRITVSLRLQPRQNFRELGDDLRRTIDYAAVCGELRRFVDGRADRLIETLAHAMAGHLLASFEIVRVELELRKFILPETKYVAVKCSAGL